jgi:hypothetical protein
MRDKDVSATERLNTNDRIVSDALVEGADMHNVVAIAARRGCDRDCDFRNGFA